MARIQCTKHDKIYDPDNGEGCEYCQLEKAQQQPELQQQPETQQQEQQQNDPDAKRATKA